MKKLKKILLSLFLITASRASYSSETIKLAILDNFKYQKYVTTKYKDYYIQGLTVAINEAKNKGINIEYKIFQYDQEPLSVLTKIPELLTWNPDVIIGPRDSNKFLMLATHIKETLTISPFATSLSISKMPSNFFSITLSDLFEAKAMYNFVQWKFPNKDLVILTEAECKSCADVSEKFIDIWLKNKKSKPDHKYFISQQVTNMDLTDIVNTNNNNKIFLIANNAHNSAVLMARITELSRNNSTFIGGDGWGSWEDTEVGKLGNTANYLAYHVVPWGLESRSKDISKFQKQYKNLFNIEAKNKLSFIVYRTAMSIVSSYDQYGKNITGSTKTKLLLGYKKALSTNNHWYKPTDYLVYKMHNNRSSIYASVNPITNQSHDYDSNANE